MATALLAGSISLPSRISRRWLLSAGLASGGGGGFVDEVIGILLVSKGIIGIDLDGLGYIELHGAKVRES